MVISDNTLYIPSRFQSRLMDLGDRVSNTEVFPSKEDQQAFLLGFTKGDPVAERYVDDVVLGGFGAANAQKLLNKALIADAELDKLELPDAMRALVENFNTVPDWVRPDDIELGASVWRRWGAALGKYGGASTLNGYVAAAAALPLSLAGGYTGDLALNRFLETTKWWLEVSRPGAILQPGSLGRAISLHVRVMHVTVRQRVKSHPEWDSAALGLPICMTLMMLTLLDGSVGAALALRKIGFRTSHREMEALLHFQRYCGYLTGCQEDWYPQTLDEAVKVLTFTKAIVAVNDSGKYGTELIASYPNAFKRKKRTGSSPLDVLRDEYGYRETLAYVALFVAEPVRRANGIYTPVPWQWILQVKKPVILAQEAMRRLLPSYDRSWQKSSFRRWSRWQSRLKAGRADTFSVGDGKLRR